MSKNIIIYSDGTGQRGGVLFDEPRSNIYKLFRATRGGPESSVNPSEQVTFYDPGIGTKPQGQGFLLALRDHIENTVSQALGLGLTGNIIDCYAALVRHWRPGDKVFLIGFSRGAYTVRCLGGVIGMCGVPTIMGDGQPLKVDMATSRQIAKEAVKKVYQHTHSRPRKEASDRQNLLLDQRQELARRFRQKYGSGDGAVPNVFPHFVGVFDTVAALGSPVAFLMLLGIVLAGVVAMATLCWWLIPLAGMTADWTFWFAVTFLVVVGGAYLWNLKTRIRWEFGLPHFRWWLPFHLLDMRMKFYDTSLNTNVMYARHALAIDERRKSFNRVPWGSPGEWPERPKGGPQWFEQLWFAGCHSDIGGSYPEEESRLSDISLKWMLDAAVSVGLIHEPSVMKLYPDPTGMQHDETRRLPFKWARKIDRDIKPDAPLHPSVLERLKAKEVLQYDVYDAYRPAHLRDHKNSISLDLYK
nr:DUF2235 domain-containing protein [uncultured Dongia sp.]